MKDNEKTTKYYVARINAKNSLSRQKAAMSMNINLSRLLKIELGRTTAYPEEICKMSREYKAPDLINYYCSQECPIGKKCVEYIEKPEMFKSSIQLFAALNKSESIIKNLLNVLEDGVITANEESIVENIIENLDAIIKQANAIKLANALRKK